MTDPTQTNDALQRRLEQLEREHARLRKKTEAIFGPDNPDFDAVAFQRVLKHYSMYFGLGLGLFLPLLMLPVMSGYVRIPKIPVGPTVLIDPVGMYSGRPGLGMGIIAFGGAALGVVAIGGGAIGVVALGGGSIGLVAIGGGSAGLIAFGGGAIGVIAIGGSGYGYYVLAGQGSGKYVLSLKRQDPEAIEFFVRIFPKLRDAITTPMPVIPVERAAQPRKSDSPI